MLFALRQLGGAATAAPHGAHPRSRAFATYISKGRVDFKAPSRKNIDHQKVMLQQRDRLYVNKTQTPGIHLETWSRMRLTPFGWQHKIPGTKNPTSGGTNMTSHMKRLWSPGKKRRARASGGGMSAGEDGMGDEGFAAKSRKIIDLDVRHRKPLMHTMPNLNFKFRSLPQADGEYAININPVVREMLGAHVQ